MSVGMMAGSFMGTAQSKGSDQRMDQDIEVAENILGTLLRQQTGRRNFFPMEVKGNYVPGYGVTFRLPWNNGVFRMFGAAPEIVGVPGTYSYSYSYNSSDEARESAERDRERAREARDGAEREQIKAQTRVKTPKAPRPSDDSLSEVSIKRFLEVSKNFLADYGDVISGLKPEERITVTNRSEGFEGDFEVMWMGGRQSKRHMMSVEAKRGDIDQLKQGKLSRADFMTRLKVVDTESADAMDPDLEVLSSMFNRLYREDLSRTYYVQGNIGYERLKDFGAIYYMKVYSSLEQSESLFTLPTQDLRDVPQAERDKKVKDLYPKFESDLKDNIVEYGRTLRSLKDNEQLVFNVRLTKCEQCGIPNLLELSISSAALKEYSSGKATKEATLAKMNVKKTGVQ